MIIFFFDVIEHLKKPEEFMNSLNNKMGFFSGYLEKELNNFR